MGFDGMLVVFFSSLPGGCQSFSESFLVFVHDGILGFLVTDYALLWFRLFMLCFMSSGSLFLVSVMSSLFTSCCLGLLLVCCSVFVFGSALAVGAYSLSILGAYSPFVLVFCCRLCFALLFPACQLGLGSVSGSLFPQFPGSLFLVIVYACIVDLLVSSDVYFLSLYFLHLLKKKRINKTN